MPRHCSICQHPRLRDITADLMRRASYRTLQAKYGISKSSIERHVGNHVSAALRRLQSEMTVAAEVGGPVLEQMRGLNARALRILGDAEAAQDRPTALHAIRECRRNLDLIARLTGELDPRAASETPGAPLHVTINYVDKAIMAAPAPTPLPEAARLNGGAPSANEVIE
jgi:hypothetical protein